MHRHAGFRSIRQRSYTDAIRSWKKSLACVPTHGEPVFSLAAERESNAESDFRNAKAATSTLHFEGKDTSETFRRDLLAPSTPSMTN